LKFITNIGILKTVKNGLLYQIILVLYANVVTGKELKYEIDEPYHYPIERGTEQWRAAVEEIGPWEATQIPMEQAERMTTRALALSCMNYPMRVDVTLFDTPALALRIMRARFNGLNELMKRTDAGPELSRVVREMNVKGTAGGARDHDTVGYTQAVFVIAILNNEEVLRTLSKTGKDELLEISVDKIRDLRGRAGRRSATETLFVDLALTLMLDHDAQCFRLKPSDLNDDELWLWGQQRIALPVTFDKIYDKIK
jgi:hypothetical protein